VFTSAGVNVLLRDTNFQGILNMLIDRSVRDIMNVTYDLVTRFAVFKREREADIKEIFAQLAGKEGISTRYDARIIDVIPPAVQYACYCEAGNSAEGLLPRDECCSVPELNWD